MRSSWGISADRALSSVVLPEPVPPATAMSCLSLTAHESSRENHAGRDPSPTRLSSVLIWPENLRMVTAGPSMATGRDDRVHAVSVRQARVHDGTRVVQPAAERRQDAVHDEHDLLGRVERRPGGKDAAITLVVDRGTSVHHDLGDRGVVEQGLKRTQAHYLVDDLPHESVPLVSVQLREAVLVENGTARHGKLLAHELRRPVPHEGRDLAQAQTLDKTALETVPELAPTLAHVLVPVTALRYAELADALEHAHG